MHRPYLRADLLAKNWKWVTHENDRDSATTVRGLICYMTLEWHVQWTTNMIHDAHAWEVCENISSNFFKVGT
jgi:hypothetical protein